VKEFHNNSLFSLEDGMHFFNSRWVKILKKEDKARHSSILGLLYFMSHLVSTTLVLLDSANHPSNQVHLTKHFNEQWSGFKKEKEGSFCSFRLSLLSLYTHLMSLSFPFSIPLPFL
jgi:hypothetical protein